MTTPSVVRSGIGARDVQIFSLDTSGYPAATSTAAYEGIDVSGVKSVNLNPPESRLVPVFGDDRVFLILQLPPTEPVSGDMTVSKINDTVDAALTGQSAFTVGDMPMFGVGTNKQGSEPQVAVLAFQQAAESDEAGANFGRTVWHWILCPKAFLSPAAESMNENPTERRYTIRPQYVTKHLWQTAFASGTEGFTRCQILRGVSEYRPKIVAFKGNNTETSFALPTNSPVVSTATGKLTCWVNGVLSTAYTFTTGGITFTTAPTTNAMVVVLYEVESED